MSTATEGQARRGGEQTGSAVRAGGRTAARRTAAPGSGTPRTPRTGRVGRPRPVARTSTGPAVRERAGAGHAPRVPFVLLILALLGGAMICLLALRTVLTEDTFTASRLLQENSELSDREQALRERVLHAESPEVLEERARELGMEPGRAPYLIDPETGEIMGGGGTGSAQDLPGTQEQADAGSAEGRE
ncbi:hypothetical protein HDA32_003746 [Spinactinospora alkalitolerans]|uniref:Cell division protein FtsL n=1 Tax=Spinactinospora alkalitolerans TaxID=687207 RepID=A0A852TVV6_9ACTN|nr:hypothetical protein [Spinactinospora alkalitolerans]NYE48626.1 hypothetical protein [Spinactinospora alkalitolerans]